MHKEERVKLVADLIYKVTKEIAEKTLPDTTIYSKISEDEDLMYVAFLVHEIHGSEFWIVTGSGIKTLIEIADRYGLGIYASYRGVVLFLLIPI